MKTYIDTTDVAKMARRTLREQFPHTTFSVRSSRYAGGSSIHVSWTDGPTSQAVKKAVGHLHGTEFDGMTDLAYPNGSSYGNDYIFCDRDLSDNAIAKAVAWVRNNYAIPTGLRDDETSRDLLHDWNQWTILDLARHQLRDIALP